MPRAILDEIYYKLLDIVERSPTLSQRELARELGVSLGKINYCIRAVVKRGWVKASNFRNSRHKAAYMYYLTPTGLEEKARMAYVFLARKLREVEELRAEVDRLQKDRADGAREGLPETSGGGA